MNYIEVTSDVVPDGRATDSLGTDDNILTIRRSGVRYKPLTLYSKDTYFADWILREDGTVSELFRAMRRG